MLFDDDDGDDDFDDKISPIKPIRKINRDMRSNGSAFAQVLRANISAQRSNKEQKASSVFQQPHIRKRIYEDAIVTTPKNSFADVVDLSNGKKKPNRDTYGPAIKRNAKIFNPYASSNSAESIEPNQKAQTAYSSSKQNHTQQPQANEFKTTFDPYAVDSQVKPVKPTNINIDESKVRDAVIVKDNSIDDKD